MSASPGGSAAGASDAEAWTGDDGTGEGRAGEGSADDGGTGEGGAGEGSADDSGGGTASAGAGPASATGPALTPASGSRAAAAVTPWPSVIALPYPLTIVLSLCRTRCPAGQPGGPPKPGAVARVTPICRQVRPPVTDIARSRLVTNVPSAWPCYLLWSLCTERADYRSRWKKQGLSVRTQEPLPQLTTCSRPQVRHPPARADAARAACGRITRGFPGKALTACGYTVHAPCATARTGACCAARRAGYRAGRGNLGT